MIRAKDLAAKLGVSAATVSLVLNDKPGICDDTRRELRKRIVDMGYGYMLKTPEKKADGSAAERNTAKEAADRKKFAFVIYPVCKECGDIFEMTAYQADEIENAVSLLKSALNQIKVLANLNEEEFNDIVELIAWFDEKIDGSLVPYYMGMIKRLSGEDKRRNRDNGNQKGRVGNIGGNMGVSARNFR